MSPLSSLVSLALLVCQAQALYFYIDGPTQKCFFEELPKDTLVVGKVEHKQGSLTMNKTDIEDRHIQGDTMERPVPLVRREP